jgi:hypothetical protein
MKKTSFRSLVIALAILSCGVFSSANTTADKETSDAELSFPKPAPAGSTVWMSRGAKIKNCQDADADADVSDIVEGQALLEGKGIRVLATERNIDVSAKKPTESCGEDGAQVGCFLILGKDRKMAAGLGFRAGGMCNMNNRNRVH